MEQRDVQEAFKNIFPEGKGSSSGRSKDVLVTESQDADDDEDGDF